MTNTLTLDPESTDPESLETPDPTSTSKKAKPSGGLFRAFWRWHFYASFLVIPVLLVLASTGLIYLLRFQIEPLLHADVMKVDIPADTSRLSYDQQAAALLEEYPNGRIAAVLEPDEPDRSTDFSLSTAAPGTPAWEDDTIREVYVNPYTGEVLGSLDPNDTISGWAKNTHKDMMLGTSGQYVKELGACWALGMAISGYYLFFKGRAARARRKVAKAAGAALRHRHATVGLFVGIGLLGLVASGLPWTIWWGTKVQEYATTQGTSMWSSDPGAQSSAPTLDASVPHSHNVAWGQGKSEVPTSRQDEGSTPVGLDEAIAAAGARGLTHPFTVVPPADGKGVYSVMGYAFNDPTSSTVRAPRRRGSVRPAAVRGAACPGLRLTDLIPRVRHE